MGLVSGFGMDCCFFGDFGSDGVFGFVWVESGFGSISSLGVFGGDGAGRVGFEGET